MLFSFIVQLFFVSKSFWVFFGRFLLFPRLSGMLFFRGSSLGPCRRSCGYLWVIFTFLHLSLPLPISFLLNFITRKRKGVGFYTFDFRGPHCISDLEFRFRFLTWTPQQSRLEARLASGISGEGRGKHCAYLFWGVSERRN